MSAPNDVFVPAEVVRSGAGIPLICTWHGESATTRRTVTFYARLSASSWFGDFVFAHWLQRERLVGRDWPFCERCERGRKTRQWLGAGLGIVALVV